jgi:alkylation response protein AidB-like acyl-CoA dehydrogenase
VEFTWSEEQLELLEEAACFARDVLEEDVASDDEIGRFSREKWEELARWGFFRLTVPADEGGRGLDPMTALAITEGLGRGCSDTGLLFSAGVQAWIVVPTLLRYATEEQKNRYLPGLLDGSVIAALAVTEPDSGSDAFAMKTSATRSDGGWQLHGRKAWITNAPVAGLVLCFARTGAGGALGAVSVFLLETEQSGVTTSPSEDTQGLRTSPLGELRMERAFVPESGILGRLGFGLAVFNEAMEWERSFAMSIYIGMLERQLCEAVTFARERQAFGEPISKFQSVANRLVDMKLRLETARLLLYRACSLKARGRSVLAESAMAKLWLSEAAVANSLDAIQVHGAQGYVRGSEAERGLRNAVGARIHSGTSDMQRIIIARSMNL